MLKAIAREVMRVRQEANDKAGFVEAMDPGSGCPPDALDFVERMAVIRDSMTFAQSRVDAVAEMARESKEVREPTGTSLWLEGDPPDDMIIIVSGMVECRSDLGQRFKFGPGDVIVEVDQEEVRSPSEVAERVEKAKDDGYRVVTLLVFREGDFQWIAVRLDNS